MRCHSTYENQFSSLSDVKQALLKANIELGNIWNDSSGLQHAQATIGSLNISLQFPWPINSSGIIHLPSNETIPVPNIQEFAGRLASQVGINGSLPPLQLVGVGNFGFAIETFVISFDKGNVSSIQMAFSIPGWDALNKFQFKVVQPKLKLQLGFLTQKYNVIATGFITAINQVSHSNIPGLPIELTLPENPDEFLEIRVADRNAVVDLSSLVSLLSARMDRDTLEAISDISQSITVPTFILRVAAGLSNFSIVNVTTISTKPFAVLGKMIVINATLELSDSINSFQATIESCGQRFLLNMFKGKGQFLTMEVSRSKKPNNMSVYIEGLLSCAEEIEERRPDISFMQLNISFPLHVFQISYRLKPKLELANISILVGLPSDWNIFSQASVPTKLLNLTLSVRITIPSGYSSADINAGVLGQVVIGQPTLLDFSFVVEIPTKAKPLSLSLQDANMMRVNFANILRLGGLSSAFPSFLNPILTDVLITKFQLQFSSSLTGSFQITEFEMIIPSRTKWIFPFLYLGNMKILHKENHTLVHGQIVLGNFSLPCHFGWPPSSQGPVIELSKFVKMNEVAPFISGVYRAFFGSNTLHGPLSGLRRTKLSLISSFSIGKALFHLTNELSLAKVTLTGALPKYSWELLNDFFSVENVTFSINIEVRKAFVIFIRGTIALVKDIVHIPFELNVPLSSNQTLTITLAKHQEPRVPFKQINGILFAGAESKFPTDLELGSFLPQLILQKLEISFDEGLTAFVVDEFIAVCSTSWDLGGIGVLKMSNVTIFMTRKSFQLRGVLLLGSTNLELELRNTSAGQVFRLLKPMNASELDKLLKDALEKMVPGLKRVPDARLIDLNILDASLVKFAEIQLSNRLDSLSSFAVEVQISKAWSFFHSCCSLIDPTMNLRVKDLNDIPSYTLGITASLEFADSKNRLEFPLEFNIPDSLRSEIELKLTSPVIFNFSKVAMLPMVGKLIPSGLLTPISDFIGDVRLWPLEAHFQPRTARMRKLNLTATALKQWSLKGFPLKLENITLDLKIWHSFHADLLGMFVLMAHPISFQIPFSPSLPHLPEMKMRFEGFPAITMTELGIQLIGGFDLQNLFPSVFDKLKISLKFLNLRLFPPLSKLQIQSFSLSFSLKGEVTLIDNWLRISDIATELSVVTVGEVSVAGRLSCLITIGTGANVIKSRGILTMPHLSSQAWKLAILSGEANQLSAANIVALTGGGFDLKSLFPDKVLSKAEKFVLNSFTAAFTPNPRFRVFNITCAFEANLSDVWLPLGINIKHIRVKLFVENPFDSAKQKLKVTIYVEIQLGKAIIPTVLSVYKDFVRLEIESLKNQPLSMSDLASAIGGVQMLNIVPAGFLNFNMVTLNSLNITFSKPRFAVLNANIRCYLHGFDVGFSFPLPLSDPSNIFKASLAVRYLELDYKQNKFWELTAGIKASFTGIPLEEHFRDLQGLMTVTPRVAILTITKKLLDVKVDGVKLAGLDCKLNVKFSDPKIVFGTLRKPELGVSLDVSGFDTLNKLLPFKVFKDKLEMDVLITQTRGLAIKLKTIPILDRLIPCKKQAEEYICDFTWLCQKDSYVRLKLPSLAYTKDGFSALIDVQRLDKLCIPLMLPFMRKFFKDIPFLGDLFDLNIPLWPPPDIIGSLKRIGCNVDNLPRGMERFKNPEFPSEITVSFSVAENGPLKFSLEVQTGQSVDLALPVSRSGDLAAISLRRFSIGSAFGVPFVDIDGEMYLWDLKFLILLSRLPKTNPLVINAAEMETRIICKDCFFIIVGFWPIPIFGAPFSIKYPTVIDVTAQATIFHRRPDFRDFSEIASLLVGLLKYFTNPHYLLSLEDFKNTNSTLLVLKLSHENELTMIQLPKYTGGNKLKLNVPPIDGKRFLIGWMNFMKTFEPKWLLQIVPLKYRVLDIAFNIGPFRWPLLKFAASSPNELKQNKDIWPYPVKESGDDALLIASSNLILLSIDATFRMKNFGNAGLSFALNAGITKLVTINFHAKANVNLADSSNPMVIFAKAELKLLDAPLLSGEVKVTKDTITVVGKLKFNLAGIVRFGGMVEAAYGPGLVFRLDSSVNLHLVGVRLLNSHLRIHQTPSRSVVRATALFMGSQINIELTRRGSSLNVQAQVKISVHLRIDLGKMSVFGRDIGRIALSTGFECDLKISFPGRSTLKVSFHFMGTNIKLPSLTFDTRDARPDRIPALVIVLVKTEAPALIKELFLKNPHQLLRALIEGLLKFAGNAGALVKDLIKLGFQFGAELVKNIGRFLNNLVNTAKVIAKAAEKAAKFAAKAAKKAREAAEKAVENADKVVQQASKAAQKASRRAAVATQALIGAVGKVIRLDNAVKEAKRIFKNISRELKAVVNRIADIAHKIASEIARGLRNLAGKVIETVGGWFGKRAIYRRDALTNEKKEKEREKEKLLRNQSDRLTRVRNEERKLGRAQREEQRERNASIAAKQEALRSSESLRKAIKDKAEKVAVLEEIKFKSRCVTGEHNCHPNATCLRSGPDGQSFQCICRRGWIGDGVFCERPIKSVEILSDSPKAVGDTVSFASFTLDGTNVQYSYSFNGTLSEYGFASHVFNSPGVYFVDIFAKNNVSNSTASEIVVVQLPVSNVTLEISGDRRACRKVNLLPSAIGTNVSFVIDFGDNTSLDNVTESVTHHFPRSGEFVINVTASNAVSSRYETFVLNISFTPCDQLYCDIWALEMKFPDKSLTQIALLAWSVSQSSEADNRDISLSKIWRYLSLYYPGPYSILQETNKESVLGNFKRRYAFAGSQIDIEFILAGILSSRMRYLGGLNGNESSLLPAHIQKPLETFTWIAAVLLNTADFVTTWNTSRETKILCQEWLPASITNSAVDGFNFGIMITSASKKESLSNIIHEYYCPSNQDVRYTWKNRYLSFYNLSKPNSYYNPVSIASTLLNLTTSLQGFVSPVKDLCLGYFINVLQSELNVSVQSNESIERDICQMQSTCQQCVFSAINGKCFWCEQSQKCLPNTADASCNQSHAFFKTPCPNVCHLKHTCSECVSQPNCGWCGSKIHGGSSFCTEGRQTGPKSVAMCNAAEWYYGTCASSCPTPHGQTRVCSAKGICKTGQCLCLPGYYDKDCSKSGCVYRIKQNDTLSTISMRSNTSAENIRLGNSAQNRNTAIAVNSFITIPKPGKDSNCVNAVANARFNKHFPRLLRKAKNRAGLDTFCGLFGSMEYESDPLFSCKAITIRQQCLASDGCAWNVRDPCTGILFEGCFRLTHWLDLLVNESKPIYSPISGNIRVSNDTMQIIGWPKSEWEDYIVTVSHFRPYNITSVQSGQVIGTSKKGSILPNFVRLSIAQGGVYKDPLAFLSPCSPGCSQVLHFYNGICDQPCNTEECNHDNGECISYYHKQSDFLLEPRDIQDVYAISSLNVLYHLQKITGEKSINVARGPLNVYSLAKLIALEIINSAELHSSLVYKNYRHQIVKFIGSLTVQNMSMEKITLSVAKKLLELGVHNVSPHGRSGTDYDILEIPTTSLKNQSNFLIGLEVLMEARLLDFTLVKNYSRSETPYFHLQIPRETSDTSRLNNYDPTMERKPECDSLHSCSGHGVCLANGSCKCDLFYMGRKCQMNNCPGRCSGHGTCIEGVCACAHGWDGEDCSKVKLCTPLCPESWIGDGHCDADCDVPKCLHDKGDCRNVCVCPKAWLGDGSCDQKCNNTVCKYDGGDCAEKECSPGCKSKMLADGFCDHECNTDLCGLDKGDCKIVSNCSCDQNLLGNGMCDEGCNIASCLFDYGDCSGQIPGGNCPPACSPPMIANGFCDIQCNESACKFDGGDCTPTARSAMDLCFEGCLPIFRGDGVCDSVCNVQACDFDNGDCPKPVVQECAPDCAFSMIGDGTCQSQCQVKECSFDTNDCYCAPGCLNSTLGDGICNRECFVKSCDYDNMDCMCSPKKCPKSSVGNGHCDVECNNKICDFDGGDCTCAPGCSVTSIGDGSCDPTCNTRLCHFDGLDCGGCETESHLNICDENAFCLVNNYSLPFVKCQCKTGFYGDGFSCVKRGNCFNGSDICSIHGKCIESNGTFECYCHPGWVGNGIFCENVDECKDESHNCNIHAKCVDLPGEYKCVCEAGWTGDGFNCTDIDECQLIQHSCCENEDCVNLEGNYSCSCEHGWREIVNSSSPAGMERCVLNINPLCVDVDECTEGVHNCSTYKGQENAICTNTIGGFQCSCIQGWQGDGYYCNDFNECDNGSVCDANQLCRNAAGNYSCICKEGWTFIGPANEECHDVDECTLGLDDCDSFATCINTNGSFTCECREGFEDKGRTCMKYQCRNQTHNESRSSQGNATQELCSCVSEYTNTGRTCVDIDECKWNMSSCPPSAPVCQNVIGGYECKCDAVSNSSCEPVNPCAPGNNTCNENMTCIAVGVDHYCACPDGYTLDQNATSCVDINECLSLEFYGSCDANADCINRNGGFECMCRPGFFQSGSACFEIDECQGTITQKVEGRLQECRAGVCASAQTCIYRNVSSNESSYDNTTLVCACDESDNKKIDCVKAIVEVVPSGENFTTVISIPWYLTVNTSSNVTKNQSNFVHNCTDKAFCNNTAGSYECICLEGFESNNGGWTCHDANECLKNDSCHSNATCFNTDGSFYCECKSGFTGNGLNCSDVNECFLGTGNCTHNSYCVNTVGSYICACLEGFHRNNTLLCDDLDECLSSDLNKCHPRASCHNYIGAYNCSCIQGYSGNGFTCSDINECRENSSLCGEHASCYNTLGSYRCKCDPGWKGDGQNCTNVDECALRVDKCIENSYCIDNQGSYTCSCYPGWKHQWFEPYGRCSRCDPTMFCSGHGQCLRNGICDCLSYYSGQNCSVCNPEVRCSGHGTCDFNGTCYCEQAWTRQPLDCSICSPEKLCSGHGKCNYNLMTYKNQSCFCDEAYFGNNCSNGKPITFCLTVLVNVG